MSNVAQDDTSVTDRVSAWIWSGVASLCEQSQLTGIPHGELDRIARDIGLHSGRQLTAVVARGRDGAQQMPEMAELLGVDVVAVREALPAVVREMEVNCCLCANKARCESSLEDGTAKYIAHQICPNTETFSALAVDFAR